MSPIMFSKFSMNILKLFTIFESYTNSSGWNERKKNFHWYEKTIFEHSISGDCCSHTFCSYKLAYTDGYWLT